MFSKPTKTINNELQKLKETGNVENNAQLESKLNTSKKEALRKKLEDDSKRIENSVITNLIREGFSPEEAKAEFEKVTKKTIDQTLKDFNEIFRRKLDEENSKKTKMRQQFFKPNSTIKKTTKNKTNHI